MLDKEFRPWLNSTPHLINSDNAVTKSIEQVLGDFLTQIFERYLENPEGFSPPLYDPKDETNDYSSVWKCVYSEKAC